MYKKQLKLFDKVVCKTSMTGFKPQTSDVGSNFSTNGATTIAIDRLLFLTWNFSLASLPRTCVFNFILTRLSLRFVGTHATGDRALLELKM